MVLHSSLRFRFDSFEKEQFQPGRALLSDEVNDGLGNVFAIDIYPGGQTRVPGVEESDITVFLFNKGEHDVQGKVSFIVRDAAGHAYSQEWADDVDRYVGMGRGIGLDLPIKRSEIIDMKNNILIDGSLVIDAELQIVSKQDDKYQPSNPLTKNMLALLDSGDDADVSFRVEDTVIPAHKFILKVNANDLYECVATGKGKAPVPIKDTSLEVFRIVLRYVYGADLPDESVLKEIGRDIIEAANLYGVIDLKVAVETELVDLLVINMKNVVDWLLFADTKMCPLLKEYAISFFVTRAADILNLESSKRLKEAPDLFEELMVEVARDRDRCREKARGRRGRSIFHQRGEVSVGELRRKLDEKGLDVDGSKEILVSRLEGSNKRLKTE